ncbi:hypothetical protein IL306_009646 [Fusarium sp. DS 682]|nr:hypothetical protein IL306_009646 [Fusarium sp. DS 682]
MSRTARDVRSFGLNMASTQLSDNKENLPCLVSELKPVGVVDPAGTLIGVRFNTIFGDDTNVMAYSDIMRNTCIY